MSRIRLPRRPRPRPARPRVLVHAAGLVTLGPRYATPAARITGRRRVYLPVAWHPCLSAYDAGFRGAA